MNASSDPAEREFRQAVNKTRQALDEYERNLAPLCDLAEQAVLLRRFLDLEIVDAEAVTKVLSEWEHDHAGCGSSREALVDLLSRLEKIDG